jgi:hypothetical protein
VTLKSLGLAAVCAVAIVAPAMAHHSFAMFDNDKTVTLKGTVKELEWSNPHAWLYVMAPNADGKSEEWAFEMASPFQLVSKGWKPDSLKPGDQITVLMHPMKDGSHGGSYVSVTLPNGTVLGQQPRPGAG